MHSNVYTIIFTSIVTVLLGSFISTAAGTLEEKQDLNVENDRKKNILRCFGYKQDPQNPWTDNDIKTIFENNIDSYVVNANGVKVNVDPNTINPESDSENFPIYIDQKNGVIQGYAIPISGKGLWSTLYGYFSIYPDAVTAKGITFYAHKETPGLGGEVDKPWFQNNFVGKKFVDKNGDIVGIKVAKGKADPNSIYEVDGISGATITSKGVEKFLLDDLKKYDSFFNKLRQTET